MVTFEGPEAAAGGVSASLRVLAHETRTFHAPARTYEVVGELLAAVGALRQVLEQVADVHASHRDTVRDDDQDLASGRAAAVEAESALRQAAAASAMVEQLLDRASASTGRIVWPGPGVSPRRQISSQARRAPEQLSSSSFGRSK